MDVQTGVSKSGACQTVFDLLNEIDVLLKVLCEIVVEYMFSLYKDTLIKTVKFVSGYFLTTIKNNKIYSFSVITQKMYVCNVDLIYYFNEPSSVFVQNMENDVERIYVAYNEILYIFDEKCNLLDKSNSGNFFCRYKNFFVLTNNCVYLYNGTDSEDSKRFILKYDMSVKRIISSKIFESSVVSVVFYNNYLYVLLKNKKIVKLNDRLKMLEEYTFLNVISAEYLTNFCIIEDEIYVTTDNYIYIFSIDGYNLRLIEDARFMSIISNRNMLYMYKYHIYPNGIMHIYQRKKIKLY